MSNWSYEKWVERIELYATDERELYKLVNEIFDTGWNDGYTNGYGGGKCACPGG
jgi:hypothetical protein